jgi:hypothetical protein
MPKTVSASAFTWNPHPVGLAGDKFTADTMLLGDYAQIVFKPTSEPGVATFTDVGIMPILGFTLNGQPVAPPGYLDPHGWGAYISYSATGVQTFSPEGFPQAATFDTLTYEIVGYNIVGDNDSASFGFDPASGEATVGGGDR